MTVLRPRPVSIFVLVILVAVGVAWFLVSPPEPLQVKLKATYSKVFSQDRASPVGHIPYARENVTQKQVTLNRIKVDRPPAVIDADSARDTVTFSEETEFELQSSPSKLFWMERAWPVGEIPNRARENALATAQGTSKVLQADRTVVATDPIPVWQSVGPQPIVDYFGQVISGHIEAIALDPRNSNIVYAGASGGGVWKSLDGGNTWAPLTDDQAALDISVIAIDPTHPETVYAATGFYYQTPGLLKSTDGGATWKSLPIPITFPESRRTPPISSLAISPVNGDLVLAAFGYNGNGNSALNGNAGVYRSLDGGQTWSVVLRAQSANKVLFDPQNPSIAYSTVGFAVTASDPRNGIYKSFDSGATWTRVGSNTLPTSGSNTVFKFQLAIAPSRSSTLYTAASDGANLVGLYKSLDGGQNWAKLGNAPNYCNFCIWSNVIAVHPTDPEIVYVAGNIVLTRSMDGGLSWSTAQANYVHPDHHSLVFSSDGTLLYDGNDGGIYKTHDVTASSVNWTSLNQSLQVTEYYQGISAYPKDANTSFGGSQDNGLLRFAGGKQWIAELFCDCFTTLVNPLDPTVVFGVQFGSTTVGSSPIQKSTNGGLSFFASSNGLRSDLPLISRVLAMDGMNPNILYFGARSVYQSLDAANHWTSVSPDLTNGTGQITAIAVAPADSNIVYAAASPADVGAGGSEITSFQGSSLWFSSNALSSGAATWQMRGSGLPNRWISKVVVDSRDSHTAYVALSGFERNLSQVSPGHVFKTGNAGLSWINISANLPDIPVSDIVIDPDSAGTLYIASDVGVFLTRNDGQTWALLGSGLPHASVTGLVLQRASGILRASTWGRGVWDLALGGTPQINSGGIVNNASYNLASSSVAPGSIAAIFGSKLTDGSSCLPPTCNPAFGSNGRLNTSMAGAQVSVNGTLAPIFYATPTQLGIQIPFELTGTSAQVVVSVGQASTATTATLALVAPGIFTYTADGKGAGAITHVNGSAVTTQSPAQPGELVILYATGLGQVVPAVSTGALPVGTSSSVSLATLTIGGIGVTPDFAGLAGCCVGLNQINARVPVSVSRGDAVPVVLSINGKSSNTVSIAVQ